MDRGAPCVIAARAARRVAEERADLRAGGCAACRCGARRRRRPSGVRRARSESWFQTVWPWRLHTLVQCCGSGLCPPVGRRASRWPSQLAGLPEVSRRSRHNRREAPPRQQAQRSDGSATSNPISGRGSSNPRHRRVRHRRRAATPAAVNAPSETHGLRARLHR